jgi:hypothetical protein
MHAIFVFDLGANQHIVYRVKDAILPPNSSLLTALGFDFVLPNAVAGGPAGGVLVPANRLVHISYYEGVDLGNIPQCNEAASVNVIHR